MYNICACKQSGEILVLLDQDISSLSIDDAHNWTEQSTSRLQDEYFESTGVKMLLPVSTQGIKYTQRSLPIDRETMPLSVARENSASLIPLGDRSNNISTPVDSKYNYNAYTAPVNADSRGKATLSSGSPVNHTPVNAPADSGFRGNVLSNLNKDFDEIDAKVDGLIMNLDKTAAAEMKNALWKAMDEYEERAAGITSVKELCKRIKDTNYSNFSRGAIEAMQKDLEDACMSLKKDPLSSSNSNNELSLLEQVHFLQGMLDEKYKKLIKLLELTDYTFIDILHKGMMSSVYLAERRTKTHKYAVKVISKSDVNVSKTEERVKRECQIMQRTRKHADFFTFLRNAFSTNEHYFLVMDYEPVGDCFSLLQRLQICLPQTIAPGFIGEICFAIQHMHDHGIVHRDIKLDNIIVTSTGHAKIMDFGVSAVNKRIAISNSMSGAREKSAGKSYSSTGDEVDPEVAGTVKMRTFSVESGHSSSSSSVARMSLISQTSATVHTTERQTITNISSGSDMSIWLDRGERAEKDSSGSDYSFNFRASGALYSLVGNINYVAPEVILGIGYDSVVDWWSLGVLVFHCITSQTPFRADAPDDDELTVNDVLQANIVKGRIDWSLLPPETTPACRNFIERLLDSQPQTRLAGKDVFRHNFFDSLSFGPHMFKTLEGPLFELVQKDTPLRETSNFPSPENEARKRQAAFDYDALFKDSIASVTTYSFDTSLLLSKLDHGDDEKPEDPLLASSNPLPSGSEG